MLKLTAAELEEIRAKISALKEEGLCSVDPEAELERRGFVIRERSLSVGWARILARLDIAQRCVFLDREALLSYAAERGISWETVRSRALAHEFGHLLFEDLTGAKAEAAAELFVKSCSCR